jgi:hypothetical protein
MAFLIRFVAWQIERDPVLAGEPFGVLPPNFFAVGQPAQL